MCLSVQGLRNTHKVTQWFEVRGSLKKDGMRYLGTKRQGVSEASTPRAEDTSKRKEWQRKGANELDEFKGQDASKTKRNMESESKGSMYPRDQKQNGRLHKYIIVRWVEWTYI